MERQKQMCCYCCWRYRCFGFYAMLTLWRRWTEFLLLHSPWKRQTKSITSIHNNIHTIQHSLLAEHHVAFCGWQKICGCSFFDKFLFFFLVQQQPEKNKGCMWGPSYSVEQLSQNPRITLGSLRRFEPPLLFSMMHSTIYKYIHTYTHIKLIFL